MSEDENNKVKNKQAKIKLAKNNQGKEATHARAAQTDKPSQPLVERPRSKFMRLVNSALAPSPAHGHHIDWQNLELVADPLILRPARASDFDAWHGLREQSRAHLTQWEPDWRDEEATRPAFTRRLRADQMHMRANRRFAFLVFTQHDQTLVGGVTLTDIRMGNRCSGVIGYWLGERFCRQGYASGAVMAVLQFGHETLGLKRIEAACQPGNLASISLLSRLAFEREGLARDYLKINDKWRDHEIWAHIKS